MNTMSRFKSLMVMTAGAATVATSVYLHRDTYSAESVWKRQKEKIEIYSLPLSKSKERRYEQLKKGLSELENSTPEDRCKFEVRFSALVERGTEEAAERHLKTKSYDPYFECTQLERIKDTASEWKGWVGMGGIILFMAGAGAFMESFRRRRY